MRDLPTTGVEVPALRVFDETMRRYLAEEKLPGGALAVVRDGRLVLARGYGWADRERRDTAGPGTLFRIASVTKPFTAAAVLALVEDGKLRLDTPALAPLGIRPFVPDRARPDARLEKITVRHLLEHSGGWDRGLSGDPMFEFADAARDLGVASPPSHRDLVRWGLGRTLDFDPGAQFAYSNFGYSVLGRVIERASGMAYDTLVKTRILAPIGISDMAIGGGRLSERLAGEARYYTDDNAAGPSPFSSDPAAPVPMAYSFATPRILDSHGGWVASVIDLGRFLASLDPAAPVGRRLPLKAETRALMFARPNGASGVDSDGKLAETYYAKGWMVRPMGKNGQGGANCWHVGGMYGSGSLMVRRHDNLAWAVVFNQRDSVKIDELLHKAASQVSVWPDHDLFAKL